MIRSFAAAAFLLCPAAAHAFTTCTTTQLAGPGAFIAEEGSNPVTFSKYIHAGYYGNGKVGVATSSDAGLTIGEPVTIFSGTGKVRGLRLAVSHQHVYALWTYNDGAANRVMFAASQNHGYAGSWSTPSSLGLHYRVSLTQIAADGPNVHVAFFRHDGSLAVRTSTNAGRSFAEPVQLGDHGNEVVITSLGANVYVAWNADRAVMFAVSHDGGKTFSIQNVSKSRPYLPAEPIFALDRIGGRLSLVWRESSTLMGIYAQSTDNGNTWSEPLVLDSPTRHYMVADDGTYVYVSYVKRFKVRGGYDWHVYLAISKDGGHTFSAGKDLSGPTGVGKLVGENYRPMPWAWDGNGAFRLTGIAADGVHIWNGRNAHILGSNYLGPGVLASPVRNSVAWQGPNTAVMYGVCK